MSRLLRHRHLRNLSCMYINNDFFLFFMIFFYDSFERKSISLLERQSTILVARFFEALIEIVRSLTMYPMMHASDDAHPQLLAKSLKKKNKFHVPRAEKGRGIEQRKGKRERERNETTTGAKRWGKRYIRKVAKWSVALDCLSMKLNHEKLPAGSRSHLRQSQLVLRKECPGLIYNSKFTFNLF